MGDCFQSVFVSDSWSSSSFASNIDLCIICYVSELILCAPLFFFFWPFYFYCHIFAILPVRFLDLCINFRLWFLIQQFLQKVLNLSCHSKLPVWWRQVDMVHLQKAKLQWQFAWCSNKSCVDGMFLSTKVSPNYQRLRVELSYKCHNNFHLLFKDEFYWLSMHSMQ